MATAFAYVLAFGLSASGQEAPQQARREISGRYPHLAVFNRQGECGIGAVVPWADRLWILTYAPHRPQGSDDKLYEITPDLALVARPESVGGTPASRLIHRESGQLIIGPYLIDADRNVRVIPPSRMPGRLTAAARHLTDPGNRIYLFDMEGFLYDVDVRSLDVRRLHVRPLPGWHGKGGYTGQGRLLLANNGEEEPGSMKAFRPYDYQVAFESGGENAGALGEWDGKAWRLVARRQFTEVTGPGGIEGAPDAEAPVWTLGWDRRSVLLKVLHGGRWSTFRLPKADYSYDGRHGWHTEWPRIREVAPGRFLANMHGGWFDVPKSFGAPSAKGLRPVGAHLKITGDVASWQGRIVFGCDDTALSTFGHGKSLAGQSQSNLWFARWEDLRRAGRPAGFGGPWLDDAVAAESPSEPFLFAGYGERVLHLSHGEEVPVRFRLELDETGQGGWRKHAEIEVPAKGYAFHIFPPDVAGEWIRLSASRAASGVTAYFHFGPGGGLPADGSMFAGLVGDAEPTAWTGGVLRPSGEGAGTLAFLARDVDASGKVSSGAWEVGPDLRFRRLPDGAPDVGALEAASVSKPDVEEDAASIIVTEGRSRFRLPRGTETATLRTPAGAIRGFREVVTERSLLNAGGSFFVVPRPNSGGVRRLKPVSTHGRRIADFCSWRGLLVLAGVRAGSAGDGHVFRGGEGGPALWFGDVDDLWRLGKPAGTGGPWRETRVRAGEPSDPFLMAGYDRKRLSLRHDQDGPVQVVVEVDVAGNGTWRRYGAVEAAPGQETAHEFPDGYSAHWVRLTADRDCRATALFRYD